jgi:hypothetical protein
MRSTNFWQGTDGSEVSIVIGYFQGSKTATASINYNTPDKLFKIESCLGKGCHVLIEQGEDQNHPTMIGIDVKGPSESMFRDQIPFGKYILLVLTVPTVCCTTYDQSTAFSIYWQ